MRATSRLALLLALALGASPAFAGEVTVRVGHNKLDPASVTIAAGDTVVFYNVDEMPGGHTVIADDGSFQSPPLALEQRWSHVVSTPGTIAYSIKEHPAARGTITVVWE
jgi:plastocyanin